MNMKENVLLVDCDSKETADFAENLFVDHKGFVQKSLISNGIRSGKLSECKRYLSYFYAGFSTFMNRNKYDVIVGWQQFHALIFCFLCNIFHVKKINTVVVLNFTYKEKRGITGEIYRIFIKKCICNPYIDYIHVSSNEYAKKISLMFGIDRNKLIVTPFGVTDNYLMYSSCEIPEEIKNKNYALSIGRSNRDFDFLISSWRNIDFPLYIISDTYQGDNKGNSNVIIKRNISGSDSYPWIANCELMIIPIDDPLICSGDTVLLNAMACERKVLITAPSTLSEMYIKDGINGYLSCKNEDEFADKVELILNSDDIVRKNAREDFLNNYSRAAFAKSLSGMLEEKIGNA